MRIRLVTLSVFFLVLPVLAAAQALGGVDVPTGGWNEPTIAVNPLDPNNIAVASNDLKKRVSLQSLRVSTDGGATFSTPTFPSVPRYATTGDPSIAFDSQGRLFWTHLAVRRIKPRLYAEMFISQVNPATGAILPGYPVNVTAAAGFSAREEHYNHKQWIAIDRFEGSPFQDRIYVVWTDELTRFGSATRDGSVVTAFSDDQDHTCRDWTYNGAEGSAQVGHHDRTGGGANPTSWNNAHGSRGCSQSDLQGTGGDGLYYCFASD